MQFMLWDNKPNHRYLGNLFIFLRFYKWHKLTRVSVGNSLFANSLLVSCFLRIILEITAIFFTAIVLLLKLNTCFWVFLGGELGLFLAFNANSLENKYKRSTVTVALSTVLIECYCFWMFLECDSLNCWEACRFLLYCGNYADSDLLSGAG